MRPGTRTFSLLVTVALHLAAVAALLQLDAVRKPLLEAIPVMVDLITPPDVKPPPDPPKVLPPKPRPVERKPEPQPPRRAAEAPSLLATESPASPGPVVAAPPPQAEPAPAAAAPPSVVPPSFNAAYLRNPPPAYPALSRRRGEKGTVVLRVHVSRQGAAEEVQVRTSSGSAALDEAALEAVRQWRFVPARQGGEPVAAWVLVPIVFKLEN